MPHPADRLLELGFRKTGAGRWRGVMHGDDVVVAVDHINRGRADEEDMWEAEVIRYGAFSGRSTTSIDVVGSERAAIAAAADWVEANKHDAGNYGGFF